VIGRPGSATRSPSILVVDDDEDNREVLGEVLGEAGYSVVCARDGAEALQLLGQLRPDVILLDLHMPIMDGLEFRAAQRRDPSLALIPTVVMTAADRFKDRMAELAPAETLRKPVKLAKLLSIVERYAHAHTN
jgi:CheY-like chemotaxis protein